MICYLLSNNIEDLDVIKELMLATFCIFARAQENNDHLEQIIEVHFPLVNLIMTELIPKYEKHKKILYHSFKILSILLTGYDTTIEVYFE